MVSMLMPGIMYIIDPASATALSPGSSSTSTNCISTPTILKSMSCARRPGGGGGIAPGRAGADAPGRYGASAGTSLSGVHWLMPAVNTSVSAVMLPLRRLVMMSSWLTGPTCWPPIAMYHWGIGPYPS